MALTGAATHCSLATLPSGHPSLLSMGQWVTGSRINVEIGELFSGPVCHSLVLPQLVSCLRPDQEAEPGPDIENRLELETNKQWRC